MNQLILSLVSLLLANVGLSSNRATPDLQADSTLNWLNAHLTEDSLRQENYETAWRLLLQLQASKTYPKLAEVHQYLADWHDFYNEFSQDSILYHQEKALEHYKASGDQKMEAAAYIALATAYLNQSKFKLAEPAIFKALNIYEDIGDKNGEGIAYRKIGQLYGIMEESEQAMEYDKKALPLLKAAEDHYNTCLTLMNMTVNYNKLQRYDPAIATANDCIHILEEQEMEQFGIEARIYAFRGDAYKGLLQYEPAEADYTKAWEIVKSVVGEDRAKEWELDIGNMMALRGNYKKALPHLLRAAAALEDNEYTETWVTYQILMDTYEKIGDHKNALAYAKKLTASRDTMLTRKIENLEEEGLLKYESGKKDEALIQKDAQIERKNRTQLWSSILIGVFVLLLAGLLYSYRKNKIQSRKLALLNEGLEARNKEKEVLLKEIHHRVKNNLQLISSLLSLQSYSINDRLVKNAILDSQSRVKSMSLIHQKLYRGTNLAAVKMKNYFETLTDSLIDAYVDDLDHIRINIDMNDVELDVDHAIPIGLITNELITNSLKYAFPDDRAGSITIRLHRAADDLVLDVSDDGIGVNNAPKPKDVESGFGSELVEMLTLQLKGTIEQNHGEGFHTRIKFPYAKMAA